MVDRYRTTWAAVEAEHEVKRSRFRCRLAPASDESVARAEIERARREHWDARHHCSAFVLGPEATTERSSDDGEPSGTAGAPMLEVLRGSGLTDVVAVVTRWFGGTLLGTGGLVRAYGDAVRSAVAAARVREVRRLRELRVTVDAGRAGRVETELRGRDIAVLDVVWGQDVQLRVGVPPDDQAELDAVLAELTGGTAQVRVTGESWS